MDLPGILSYRVERLKFKATNLDLGLALIATFLLPIACWLLLDWSGAFLPLILYYGVFCVAIALWRKKSFDYVRPVSWSFKLFIGLLALQIFIQTIAYLTIIPVNDPWEGSCSHCSSGSPSTRPWNSCFGSTYSTPSRRAGRKGESAS